MQNTLKYFFVLLLIVFQPGTETAHAAKPIFPSSIQKSKRDKKDELINYYLYFVINLFKPFYILIKILSLQY